MKKFILMFTLCSPMLVFASEKCTTDSTREIVQEQLEIKTDVPSHLKGATIIVRLADGKESVVPAELFKVVPRKQQFLVSKTKVVSKLTCSPELNKNRLTILAGNGPENELGVSKTSSSVTVESQMGAIGGLQYQRMILDGLSLGVQAQTNDSVLLNIGLDF